MCSKKKDLEIICNLQWKNKCFNEGERSNIIGVYDVPSTTLNWEIFKSYLLKNSGTSGDDVRVSYISTNDKEFPILSQMDFQVALYAFRKKARNGEIINLKLDRISDGDKTIKKKATSSNNVQTQFNTNEVCNNCSLQNVTPPVWFTGYMKEFKKDFLNEMSSLVSSYVSTLKNHNSQSYYSRKTKNESSKRKKNAWLLSEIENERETSKIEKKVELKLENKSKKLKEKKMALLTKSCDNDYNRQIVLDSVTNPVDTTKMNAAPVRSHQSVVPHMIGGEVYLHTWEVINNGTIPWTSETELHFTWGSALLEPVQTVVPCPPLKPGETGTINVLLNVPKICGQYESYWHFHHRGRKFGHWLGCQIIVDKINSVEPLTNSFLNSYEHLKSKYDMIELSKNENLLKQNEANEIPNVEQNDSDGISSTTENIVSIEKSQFVLVGNAPILDQSDEKEEENFNSTKEIEEVILKASPSKIQIVEQITVDPQSNEGTNINDDSNNIPDSSSSTSESISKIDEETLSNSTLNDMVLVNFADELEDQDTGYAYVHVDGTKIPIPKKYLRSDYLETAEDAPIPERFEMGNAEKLLIEMTSGNANLKIYEKLNIESNNDIHSTLLPEKNEQGEEKAKKIKSDDTICTSLLTNKNSSRKFVFPEDFPGYEVAEECVRSNPSSSFATANDIRNINFQPSAPSQDFDSFKSNEQMSTSIKYVREPNFQQIAPEMRKLKTEPVGAVGINVQESSSKTPVNTNAQVSAVVNGAMTMASTALNTAKNVVNMIIPPRNESEGGVWLDGHWVTTNTNTTREKNLQALAEMGFWDRDLNATLLARYNDDIGSVVAELIH